MTHTPAVVELASFASRFTETGDFAAIFGGYVDEIVSPNAITQLAATVEAHAAMEHIERLVKFIAASATTSCARPVRNQAVKDRVFDAMAEGYYAGAEWASKTLGAVA